METLVRKVYYKMPNDMIMIIMINNNNNKIYRPNKNKNIVVVGYFIY